MMSGSGPWFLRTRRIRRVAAVALVIDLGLGAFSAAMAVSVGMAAPATLAAADPNAPSTSSAVTVKWTDGRQTLDPDYVDDTQLDPTDKNQTLFKDLELTVSQTQDLTDQGLQVSWTGGKPTSASGAAYNFLQIMQCWAGKDATGPSPEQCQWGTPNAALASQTGSYTSTRDLMTDDEADPKQDLGPAYTHGQFGLGETNAVPFWSIDDPAKKRLGWTNDAYNQPPFNPGQSNEVTFARTGADGTGRYIVNLQSALSAPYLGCGNPALTKAGNTCWLVVVPRGEYNLNGARAQDHDTSLPQNYSYVAGSPLSASAWQDRIQVKLGFSPIGASCRLGSNEIPTAGTELAAAAFGSWQAALCDRGVTFGYSQIGDGQARGSVTTGAPPLDFMASPVDPESAGDATIEYAPVATSGLVVSYLIDKNYVTDADNPDAGSNGTMVTDLRLSPLLVAKLLTQSYRRDTPGNGANSGVPRGNPVSLRADPEFLALNPNFKFFYNSSAPDGLIVPFGDTDAARAVWAWLRSDSAARRFLSGATVGGMKINPAYLDLDLATDTTLASFPKADPSTFLTGDAPPPGFGTLDMAPYSSGFADGARRTVTATAGAKTFWDVTRVPPQYVGGAAQSPGTRFELAITTSQAASLYGLPVATLLGNTSDPDSGVAPTSDAMTTELSTRVPAGPDGVFKVDPMKSVDGGYPLTMQTYAAINVCAAPLAQLTAYATFLDYAAAGGQVPGTKLGQLPLGYAPLNAADRAQTKTVATHLRAEVRKPECASHKASAPAATGKGGASSPSSPPSTNPSAPSAPANGVTPPATPVGAPPTTTSAPTASVAAGITPAAFVTPAARYAVLAALLFALPCLIAGPSIVGAARRRR